MSSCSTSMFFAIFMLGGGGGGDLSCLPAVELQWLETLMAH